MAKATSIPARVLAVLLIGAFTIVAVFGFSIVQYFRVADRYRLMVEQNTKVARLPILLSRTVWAFGSFVVGRSPDAQLEFEELGAEAHRTIVSLDVPALSDDELREFSAFRRTLDGMLDYYRESGRNLMRLRHFDSEIYVELSYLRILADYMVVRSQQLVVAYLDATSAQHQQFLDGFEVLQRRLALGIVGIFLIDILAVFVLLRDLSSHLSSVEQSAKELSRGNWEIPDIDESRYRELSSVANAFNEMKHSIVRFVSEVEDKAEQDRLLRETQLRALQVQTNPHFLFNALNMIARSALFEDKETTISLVESVSSILRYSLENEANEVPLSMEVEIVKAYMFIQGTRFGDRISFVIDMPETIDDPQVPPMLLQPLVENAIIHGLRDKRDGGTVTLRVRSDGGEVLIEIEDNGKGFSPDRVGEVLDGRRKNDTGRTSIGLHNVARRLELAYDTDSLLSIQSVPGDGTTVTIRIPAKEHAKT
jgi:two-component system, sensor histidine kinase YesM